MQSLRDMEFLKYSIDPDTRKQFFHGFSNSCKQSNLDVVKHICQLRRDYSTKFGDTNNFFENES